MPRDSQPLYVVFAGVNGAGKSTFYRSNLWRLRDMQGAMNRVNTDEILVDSGADPADRKAQFLASKEAVREIDHLIARKKSFNQETTLAGKASLKYMKRAHDAGFRIVMYYIGLSSPEIANARIEHRAEVGGHFIEPADVERRYRVSLKHMSRAIDMCDQVIVLDNTDAFRCIAQWNRGTLAWVGDLKRWGMWLVDAVSDDSIWRT